MGSEKNNKKKKLTVCLLLSTEPLKGHEHFFFPGGHQKVFCAHVTGNNIVNPGVRFVCYRLVSKCQYKT